MPNSGKESTERGSVKHLLIILWLCNVFINGLPPPLESKEREFEAETFIAQNETQKDFKNKNKFLSAHPKEENQYAKNHPVIVHPLYWLLFDKLFFY